MANNDMSAADLLEKIKNDESIKSSDIISATKNLAIVNEGFEFSLNENKSGEK